MRKEARSLKDAVNRAHDRGTINTNNFKLYNEIDPQYIFPEGPIEFSKLTEAQRRTILLLAPESLAAYTVATWEQVFKGRPLKWGHHLTLLCWALDELQKGNVVNNNLIGLVPPRSTKSTLLNVFLSTKLWLLEPHLNILCIAVSQSIASRDSRSARKVIASDIYKHIQQEVLPIKLGRDNALSFTLDQDNVTKIRNDHGAERMSFAVKQTVIGENADWLLLDDTVDAGVIEKSPEQLADALQDVLTRYDSSWSKRLIDRSTARICGLAQKIHPNDLPSVLIRRDKFNNIVLPMEFNPDHPRVSERDWRKVSGQLLMPSIFPPHEVEKEKNKNLSIYLAQYQQMDVFGRGTMFESHMWKKYTAAPVILLRGRGIGEDLVFTSTDGADTTGERSKYSCAGVFLFRGNKLYHLKLMREKVDLNGLVDMFVSLQEEFPEIQFNLVENMHNGRSLADLLEKVYNIIRINPQGTNKVQRAQFTKRWLLKGNIWVHEGSPETNQIIEEHNLFPGMSSINDIVDVFSQATRYLEVDLGLNVESESNSTEAMRRLTRDVLKDESLYERIMKGSTRLF